MKKFIVLILAVSSTWTLSLPATAGALMFPQCKVNQYGNETKLIFTLNNPSDHSWRFLQWKTPLDAWFSEFLYISHEGIQIPYEGALMKRGKPEKDDYHTLKPDESIRVELELTQAYQLTSGKYTVEVSPIWLTPIGMSKLATKSYKLICKKIEINL